MAHYRLEAENVHTGELVSLNSLTVGYASVIADTAPDGTSWFWVQMGNSRYNVDGPIYETKEEAVNLCPFLSRKHKRALIEKPIGEYA